MLSFLCALKENLNWLLRRLALNLMQALSAAGGFTFSKHSAYDGGGAAYANLNIYRLRGTIHHAGAALNTQIPVG